MANKDLRTKDFGLKDTSLNVIEAWYFEKPGNIVVVSQGEAGAHVVRIPWRQIRASLARKDKK